MAKRRYAEQGVCSPGDSVVACDVFLAHGGGHGLYVQDRRTEKIANFLWLTDKRREHTRSPLQSQVVRPRGSSPKFGDQLVSSLGGGTWTVMNWTLAFFAVLYA